MKKIISLVMFLIVLCSLFLPAMALDKSEVTFDTASYYPVIQSAGWVNMERAERVTACQIPSKELEAMTTDDLLKTVLEYPFMIDLYAFDTYADGFAHVYSEFPALKDLAGREDFGTVLVDFYQSTPVAKATTSTTSVDYESIKNLSIIEILIAQPEMTDNLKEADINSLISIAEEKYLEKIDTMSINGGNLATFYEALGENPDSMIASVLSTPVTPNGSPVPVYDYSSIVDWKSAEKVTLNAQVATAYPNSTKLADPTKKYNCHSYAWYSTSTSNYYWMDDPSLYMSDGSYTSTTSSANGKKILWKYPLTGIPEHSGIMAKNMKNMPILSCNSKWGNLGVYNDTIFNNPYIWYKIILD